MMFLLWIIQKVLLSIREIMKKKSLKNILCKQIFGKLHVWEIN